MMNPGSIYLLLACVIYTAILLSWVAVKLDYIARVVRDIKWILREIDNKSGGQQ